MSISVPLKRALGRSLKRPIGSESFGVLIPFAPSFTTQPSSQSKVDGELVTFTSRASAYPAPTYQWYVNDGGGFDAIGGATNRILSFTATLAVNGYIYRCTATNSEGSANSSSATLTVTAASTVGGYRSFLGWIFGGYGGGV